MKKRLFAAAFVGLLTACDSGPPLRVEYKISGSASAASLTMQNAQGGSEQMTVPVPWSRSLSVQPGQFVYLSAQNQDDNGSISCEIVVDGTSFKKSTSYGAYTIAGCSGNAARPS